MYNSQIVKDRINSTIKIRNTSATKVLELCGFSPNVINQMSDKNGLSSFNLAKIADCLQVSVDYLLGRTDSLQGINQINTGDVGDHSNVNVNAQKEKNCSEIDGTALELLTAFSELSLSDKAKVMSLIAELSDK